VRTERLRQREGQIKVSVEPVAAHRPAATILKAVLACAILGALGGCNGDLIGATRSGGVPMGMVIGGVLGLVIGLLVGAQQARYDATATAKTPAYAGYISLGVACLVLSVLSFVASQRVPGLRPLVVARAPISLDRERSAQLSFTPDSTAAYAVLLSLEEDSADKLARDLGLKKESKTPPAEMPARDSVTWTSDVPGSQSDQSVKTFDSEAKRVELGSLQGEEGKKYTLTAKVVKPFPAAQALKPYIEVHRSTAAWGRAFPRMLAAGAMGLLAGIVGVMLIAYGGVKQWSAKQAAKDV
jgi:hypothetical protein